MLPISDISLSRKTNILIQGIICITFSAYAPDRVSLTRKSVGFVKLLGTGFRLTRHGANIILGLVKAISASIS